MAGYHLKYFDTGFRITGQERDSNQRARKFGICLKPYKRLLNTKKRSNLNRGSLFDCDFEAIITPSNYFLPGFFFLGVEVV